MGNLYLCSGVSNREVPQLGSLTVSLHAGACEDHEETFGTLEEICESLGRRDGRMYCIIIWQSRS